MAAYEVDAGSKLIQDALVSVVEERGSQEEKWGIRGPYFHSLPLWEVILGEECGEVCEAILEFLFAGTDGSHLRSELVQVAAVAVQMIEIVDQVSAADAVPEDWQNQPMVPVTVHQAAAILDISSHLLLALLDTDQLFHWDIGGERMIDLNSVLRFKQQESVENTAA